MSKFNLTSALFQGKSAIQSVPGKVVGNAAPTGLPGAICAAHAAGAPSKLNYATWCLDKIFYEHTVKALQCEDNIYVEFETEGNTFKCLCDGLSSSYVGNAPEGPARILPFVLYELRFAGKNEELKNAYARIRDSITAPTSMGTAEPADAYFFSDCFYYTVAKVVGEVEILPNDLQLETIEAGIRSGLLNPFADEPLSSMTPAIYSTTNSSKAQKASSKKENKNRYTEVKGGSFLLPYSWSEEQKKHIPKLESLNDYVPTEEFYFVLNLVHKKLSKIILNIDAGLEGVEAIGRNFVNALMVGRPGTGKTSLVFALAAALGMPIASIPFTKDTESDVFQGMTKVIDGKLAFVETDFSKIFAKGGIIVCEEINLANPNVVMGGIGQAIEYPFILKKNGYETVTRHPMCVVIATMNAGTYGSIPLNEALSSRFKTTLALDDPKDEDFIAILCKTGADKKSAQWVYNLYKKLTDYLMSPAVNAEDVCMRLTMRGCLGTLELIEIGVEPKMAVKQTLLGKIAESDLTLYNSTWKDVVQVFPDLK